MDLSEFAPNVSSSSQAGLLILSRTWLSELALPCPSVEKILEVTQAGRSRAYELRDQILGLLPDLTRPPGRPRKAPRQPTADLSAELTRAILKFVMDNAGCVHGGPTRRRYSEGFRHHVIELRQRHPNLDLPVFAEALGVPAGTIEDWLHAGSRDEQTSASSSPHRDAEPAKMHMIETVLNAWRAWQGSFKSFVDHVRHHQRLEMSKTMIAQILFDHGERNPARRGRSSSDEDALRGTFETFFPGAQWVGDGKTVLIYLDGEPLAYNFELMVDAASGAFVGTSIRDEEDAAAVVEAFENGIVTTDAAPISLLLDNRPSNYTDAVTEALGDTLLARSTLNRPQNKAHVEGAFGLFAQHTPPIHLDTHDRGELGKQIVALIVTLFARVMNHRPRSDRGGKSRVELYSENEAVSAQEREEAHRALLERQRKHERARRTREARLDPDVRKILDRDFARLELLDPDRHFRNAIAAYPIDAIVDAVAIFDAKRQRQTLPEGVDARYLLGIVRNLHHVHEADAITNELIRARIQARDSLLASLVFQRDAMIQENGDQAIASFIESVFAANRTLDQLFWISATAQIINSHSDEQKCHHFRQAARIIHAKFSRPTSERFEIERRLARLIWPLS